MLHSAKCVCHLIEQWSHPPPTPHWSFSDLPFPFSIFSCHLFTYLTINSFIRSVFHLFHLFFISSNWKLHVKGSLSLLCSNISQGSRNSCFRSGSIKMCWVDDWVNDVWISHSSWVLLKILVEIKTGNDSQWATKSFGIQVVPIYYFEYNWRIFFKNSNQCRRHTKIIFKKNTLEDSLKKYMGI